MGAIFPALMIMALPTLISFIVVYKLVKAREAAHWPTTPGVITKSKTGFQKETHAQQGSTVRTVAVLEYEFKLEKSVYKGSQIRAGDRFGTVPDPEILDQFPKGATVPVHYNPVNPAECVLQTRLPYSTTLAWAFAAASFMGGVAAALAFTNGDAVMERLRPVFPERAEPQGVIFFGLCALWILFLVWDNWRQASRAKRWPTTEGTVVASRTESHLSTGGPSTRGTRVRLYEPAVEYSYVVENREYHSTKVSFGASVSSAQEDVAAQRAARYPVGAKVPVHYDPEHPMAAVLETGVAFQALTIVIAVVFIGLTVFFFGVRL